MQQMVEETLNASSTYVTEQGDVEDWNSNTQLYKEKILNNMKKYMEQVNQAVDTLNSKE